MQITENSSLLITGGTGSFGKKFVETVLQRFPNIHRLVIYSRDELKQYEMAQRFSERDHPGLRYFLGDVRDRDRLTRACEQVEMVVHAAALKQVRRRSITPWSLSTPM
jgi:FlaA1/EpsC-like NDP-sugar epimerase